MMNTIYYKVAGYRFAVTLPEGQVARILLPSFEPFLCKEGEVLFRVDASRTGCAERKGGRLLEEAVNDMGHTRLMETEGGYRVELFFGEDSLTALTHVMDCDRDFTSASLFIHWEDGYAKEALCSFLRILYGQAIAMHDGISIHAAVVKLDGKGYLFMGKSGTGKSTHARMWRKAFENCELLNDDNPTLRITENGVWVYGTPWSGKTPCYINEGIPVGAMLRLKQAPENIYTPLEDIQAFVALLPGCSSIPSHAGQYEKLCDNLLHIVSSVPVGEMKCLPNEEAAKVAREALKRGL